MFIRQLTLGDNGKCHTHQIETSQEEEIKVNVGPSEAGVGAWEAQAGIPRFLCPGRQCWTKDAWIVARTDRLLRKGKTLLGCRPEPRRFRSPVALGH